MVCLKGAQGFNEGKLTHLMELTHTVCARHLLHVKQPTGPLKKHLEGDRANSEVAKNTRGNTQSAALWLLYTAAVFKLLPKATRSIEKPSVLFFVRL